MQTQGYFIWARNSDFWDPRTRSEGIKPTPGEHSPLPTPPQLMMICSVGGSAAGEGPKQSPLKAGLSHLCPQVAAGEPVNFFGVVMECILDLNLEV